MILDTALYWLDAGIATIPIGYRSKQPDYSALRKVGSIEQRGNKTVGVWRPYQKRLPTLDELKTWFSTRFRNIAIITGWKNLVVIDFDDMGVFKLWNYWASTFALYGCVSRSYRVRTGRGMHVYLFMEQAPERTIKIYDDIELPAHERKTLIDIKAAGGYVLADPSIHPSGHPYKATSFPIETVGSINDVLPDFMLKNMVVMDNKPTIPTKPAMNDPFIVSSGPSKAEWIKNQYRVLDFFPNAVPSGQNWYKALCPFHDDHRESLWINTTTNRCGCQAGCIKGSMDVIGLYAMLHNISDAEAIKDM